MVCAGRITFRPKIHGPVSTTMWLLPASAVDSSTFPMLPSTASTLEPVSRPSVAPRCGTSTSPTWVHLLGKRPSVRRPLLRRYPGIAGFEVRHPVRDETLERTCSETIAWSWRFLPGRAARPPACGRGRTVARWGDGSGFALRAVPPSAADRSDLVAEARLRAALAREPRTRGAPSLARPGHGRTAFLDGNLPPDVHDLVAAIAASHEGCSASTARSATAVGDVHRRPITIRQRDRAPSAALQGSSVGEIDLLIHRVGRDRAHGAAPDRTKVEEQDRQS